VEADMTPSLSSDDAGKRLSLAALHQAIRALDPRGALEGHTYAWCDHNTLSTDTPWWIDMPGAADQATHLSPLQQAIRQALHDGQDTDHAFIDIAHLGTWGSKFSTPIMDDLVAWINACPAGQTPVIRYLSGNPAQDPKFLENDALIQGLFQAQQAGQILRPDAMLYVGFYAPSYGLRTEAASHADAAPQLMNDLVHFLSGWAEADRPQPLPAQLFHTLAQAVHGLLSTALPAYSWNHAKLFAVNGRALITGGANFWNDYAADSTAPHDLAMYVQGDACATAHRFLDHIWEAITPTPFWDAGSSACGGLIAQGAEGLQPLQSAPLFAPPAPTATGPTELLMVARAGQWPTADRGLSPQALDATRDMLLNLIVELACNEKLDWQHAVQVCHAMSDGGELWEALLSDLQLTPALWATRAARNAAIASAQTSVSAAQQKFVMDDLTEHGPYMELIDRICKLLDLKKPGWDGRIWAYDQLAAIGDAVATLHRHGDTGAEVKLLASQYNDGAYGYDDSTSAAEFLQRLTDFNRARAECGLLDMAPDAVETTIKQRVVYARIGGENSKETQHSKFVMIDEHLCYIGSDNAYPSYNLEAGFWTDDPVALKSLVTGYWQPLWQGAVKE
jgi:phosphatidylserine/phosphatidylglycerophosphate/cardiolipin synthase-like enzyme